MRSFAGYIIFVIVILFNTTAQAQIRSVSAGFGYGFTSPHHPDMWNYITGHAQQCHVQYLTPRDTSMDKGGHTLKVLDFSFINPGNPDTMGYAIGLCPQFHFRLDKQDRTWFVLGCGLEYHTKVYSEENCSFGAVSSHLNALIILGFKRLFPIAPSWNLKTEFLWTHFSDGATKAPNLGLNIPTLGLGVEYKWKMKPERLASRKTQTFESPGRWQFVATGSWKQLKHDGKTCPAFSASVEKYFKPRAISSFSAGTDLIVDYSMNNKLTEFNDTVVPFSNNVKITLKAGWEVAIGKLQIHLQAGSYLKNSNFQKEFLFERLALRYFFTDHIGANVGLRAHFAKADAIEFGVVYRIPRRPSIILPLPAF